MYKIYCELKDKRGYKDSDVARIAGITKSTFSDWKSGRSTPKQDKLQKIADCFGVSVDYLMTGTDDTEKKETTLIPKDERDIKKILEAIKNDKNGPLYLDGEPIDEATFRTLNNAIDFVMKQLDITNPMDDSKQN